MADHKLRPGELTEREIEAATTALWHETMPMPTSRELERAIATAAYEKAMRRAAEICRELYAVDDDIVIMGAVRGRRFNEVLFHRAAAIEREAK